MRCVRKKMKSNRRKRYENQYSGQTYNLSSWHIFRNAFRIRDLFVYFSNILTKKFRHWIKSARILCVPLLLFEINKAKKSPWKVIFIYFYSHTKFIHGGFSLFGLPFSRHLCLLKFNVEEKKGNDYFRDENNYQVGQNRKYTIKVITGYWGRERFRFLFILICACFGDVFHANNRNDTCQCSNHFCQLIWSTSFMRRVKCC